MKGKEKKTQQKKQKKIQVKPFSIQKYVKPGTKAEDVMKLKQCFDIFDNDKSGNISPKELSNAITALGMQKQAKKIMTLVTSKIGSNEDVQIDFACFLDMFGVNANTKNQNNIQNLFEQFDKLGKNFINFDDFKAVCEMVGQKYTDNEIQLMIQYADKDKDGYINFDEFKNVVAKQYSSI